MTQAELFDRGKFIAAEIERAYVHADDDWKKAYYHNAAEYLSKNKTLESIGFEKKSVMIAPNAIISP